MVVGTGQLAEVAAQGVAAGVEVGRNGARIVGGLVGYAAAHVYHGRAVGGYGTVGAGPHATATTVTE